MPSPFRTSPQLGPNFLQVIPAGSVWYDPKNIVSPKVGDKEDGDDGHAYVFVQASAAIAAAASPGTAIVVTEPQMTAAAGAGNFYAPVAGVAANAYFWARKSTL
ncbi:MAG: hypothetical protein ACRYGI_11400 [Janthinobacterium lividum]